MIEANPFAPEDRDRHEVWELLVRRDSDFFLSGDWSIVADDYVVVGFMGIDAALSTEPAGWSLACPSVESYRDAAIGARWNPEDFAEPLRPAWFRCQSLARLEVAGGMALAHKHIDGHILRCDAAPLELHWRSVFHLRQEDGRWKIAGFTGYLPL